jgi:hypothetical protein
MKEILPTINTMKEILPCPNCKKIGATIHYSTYCDGFYMECNYCYANTPSFTYKYKRLRCTTIGLNGITPKSVVDNLINYWNNSKIFRPNKISEDLR